MATRRGRTQAYAAGNKVYGGGRPMPTVGPVDKTGYRERDAKGMIWKNAISRRLGGAPQQSDSMPGTLNTRTATGQPPVSPLVATPSGQLGGQQTQGMNGLPYDPVYAQRIRGIEAERAAAAAGVDQQRANWDLEANGQKREIDRAAPDILRRLLESFAGRGMAYSGRYATDQGEQQNEFARQKSAIDQQLAAQNSGLAAQLAQQNSGYDSQIGAANEDYAREMATRAGDLGIVPEEAPPVPVQLDNHEFHRPSQEYMPPAPPPVAAAPLDLASRPGGTRPMASFDPRSQATLSQGGVVVGGNGYHYKYDPNTGQTVRVK